MAEICEKSFPFDSEEISGEFDREYVADDFARYFRAFISSGTFMRSPTNLQVFANDDMTVTLKPGSLIIDGYRYDNTADITIKVDAADGVLNRIDRVVCTWDKESRDIHAELIKGEPAYTPVAPECRRTVEYMDYAVADIYVAAGVIKIVQSAITDQRLNTEVCGLATPFVELDLSTIMKQIQSYHDETVEEIEAWKKKEKQETDTWQQEQVATLQEWVEALKEDNTEACKVIVETLEQYEKDAEQNFANWYDTNTTNWAAKFTEWLDNLKAQLEGDIATNLQKQIDEVKDMATTANENIALNKQTLGYSKKNLLKTVAGTSTSSGVTITVNDDGSVIANGTATADVWKTLNGDFVFEANKKYIASGATGGSDETYFFSTGTIIDRVYNDEKIQTIRSTDTVKKIQIAIRKGYTAENLTFYPMIRSADIADGTYEPYVDDVQTQLNGKADSSHGHNNLLPSSTSAATYTTLADFWTYCDSVIKLSSRMMTGRAKLTTFVPAGGWYRYIVSSQNSIGNGNYNVTGSIILDNGSEMYYGKVDGGKTDTSDLSVKWEKICKTGNALNTLEEISANTKEEMIAGALALKELYEQFGGVQFGYTSDGKPGYYKAGADTVTPFSASGASITGISNVENSLSRMIYTYVTFDTSSHSSLTISGVNNVDSDSLGNSVFLTITGETSSTSATLAEYTGTFSATLDVTNYDSVSLQIPATNSSLVSSEGGTIAEITSLKFE